MWWGCAPRTAPLLRRDLGHSLSRHPRLLLPAAPSLPPVLPCGQHPAAGPSAAQPVPAQPSAQPCPQICSTCVPTTLQVRPDPWALAHALPCGSWRHSPCVDPSPVLSSACSRLCSAFSLRACYRLAWEQPHARHRASPTRLLSKGTCLEKSLAYHIFEVNKKDPLKGVLCSASDGP